VKSWDQKVAELDLEMDALLEQARSGDETALTALIEYFEPEVRKIASKYFLQRADFEDLIQEGRIAIYSAILSYNSHARIPFLHFARLVVKRKIIDYLRGHNRKKHINFNEAYSLDANVAKNDQTTYLDLIQDPRDPESMLITHEETRELVTDIHKQLSQLESKVFIYHYLLGLKQQELSRKLGLTPKALDNAIQRIRRKTKTMNGKSDRAVC